MDLRQFKAFVAIARQQSFTRAAEQLHIAQPAVSMAIRKLEEELELTLFNRKDKRISLTAEGEVFLRHAERILDNFGAAQTEMAELRGLSRGEVRIGIPPMMSSYYFPRVIREFRERYPELQLSVNGEGAGRIQRLIARGEIDMGVIAGGNVPEGLKSRRFLREEIVACVPAGHPLAAGGSISLEVFLGQPLILFKEGYFMRELIDATARERRLTPQVVFETNLFSLVRSLIKEGLGVSTFLRMVVSEDPDLVALSFDPPLHLDLLIAWKAEGYLSRANRAFVDFLMERVGEV
ncbi:LysR family transcriptional regulator [Desulfuromonas versatilis]|uniref:LysR family transcriptional regulator n=1 Tax=Desulfuromonas versatilis TaxID=2802975 RepID=A0ABN6DX53_9BACT|nr:LysR family transcriptional regulator [Desulfuromonas versatilis]BCR04615.1 LysR family transcriptional regulator [Desulfuromonas versatilis]